MRWPSQISCCGGGGSEEAGENVGREQLNGGCRGNCRSRHEYDWLFRSMEHAVSVVRSAPQCELTSHGSLTTVSRVILSFGFISPIPREGGFEEERRREETLT